MEAAQGAGRAFTQYDAKSVAESRTKMVADGIEIIENPDLSSIVEKVAPLADKLETEGMWSKGLFQKVRDVVRQ